MVEAVLNKKCSFFVLTMSHNIFVKKNLILLTVSKSLGHFSVWVREFNSNCSFPAVG